jgi:outer membrane protein TolC
MDKPNYMKNRLLIAAAFTLLLPGIFSLGQQAGENLKLSLKEAQDYAVLNNKLVLSAKSDVMASKAALWEVISAALPQVEASGSFTDNLKLMTTLLPGEFFGKPGEKIPVTFGSEFNSSASVTASMLIFNAPLYVGIETTKLAQKLSEEYLKKSKLDTKESVSSAYFLILVSEKSLEILNGNIENLKGTLKSTKSMYSAGMAEATDVDQMISNVNMVENSRSSLERTIELNYNILRFALGVPANTGITLTETLDNLTSEINVETLLSQVFDPKQHVDYKLIEGQELMSTLSLKSEKASILPTLSGYYNYGTNGMGDKVSELRWFQNSMAGLQLSVPILASGQRFAKIKKAQINLDKAKTTRDMITDQLLLQEKQLRYNLVNANLQYLSQKENIEVSQRIYTSMENKFKQGMASSLELTQANSQYLQAENNYIEALMSLLQTRLALDKLLNNL